MCKCLRSSVKTSLNNPFGYYVSRFRTTSLSAWDRWASSQASPIWVYWGILKGVGDTRVFAKSLLAQLPDRHFFENAVNTGFFFNIDLTESRTWKHSKADVRTERCSPSRCYKRIERFGYIRIINGRKLCHFIRKIEFAENTKWVVALELLDVLRNKIRSLPWSRS